MYNQNYSSQGEYAYTYVGVTESKDFESGSTEFIFSEDDLYPTLKEALCALEGQLVSLPYKNLAILS